MKYEYEDKLLDIIKQFGDNGILSNVIIIGSWATYFYTKIFKDFIPSIRTLDLDFYVPMNKKISVSKTVLEALKPINFDLFQDYISEKSIFASPDGFEIEFLVKLKRNKNQIYTISELGVNAEQLGNLELFDKSFIKVDFEGYVVNIASPSAYVMQKILIAGKRSEEKFQKDLESVRLVLNEISKHSEMINEFNTLKGKLGKKSTNKFMEYIEDNQINI